MNAYLSSRHDAELFPEYAVISMQNSDYSPEPWEPADSVAWLKAVTWDPRGNVENETARAVLASRLAADEDTAPTDIDTLLSQLYPLYPFDQNPVSVPEISAVSAPGTEAETVSALLLEDGKMQQATTRIQWREASDVIKAVSLLIGGVGEGIESNSWVVSGALTESGLPLLANGPHLGASLPSVWCQVQLKCSAVTDACPFDVGGFSFSGLPSVVIGHNQKVA